MAHLAPDLPSYWTGLPLALKIELFAEIEAAHIGVVDDFLRRAFGQDLALMDDESAVDELESLSHVVIRNKHPDSPSGKLSHQLANITDRNRINSGERLVGSMNCGRVARARAISTRRRSPPDSATAGECRRCETENSSSNSRNSLSRRLRLGSWSSRHEHYLRP